MPLQEVPDFTMPVSILAQIIDTLKVDIAATSIGNISVAIANAPTLNVAIQSAVTLNVNIASAPTLNVNITGQTSVINVNISSQSSALNVNILGQSSIISIKLSEIASGVTMNVAIQSSVTLNVAIQSSTTLNVNITGQTNALNVNISSITSGVIFSVAQSGTWTINAVQSGSWTVNASQTGTWTVNAQQTGTWNVNISGTPTINIQTSGGANIIIDKLTTSSVYAFRTNYNDTTGTPTAFNVALNRAYAKFYARGMRGYIQRIYFWVDGNRATDATVYAGICIDPASPPIYEASTTVTAGTDSGWFYVNIYKWWPYDSLLIYVRTGATGTIRFGRDTSNLGSGLYSDNLTDWTLEDYRYYLYVSFYAHQNVHLPVSGTVSTISVPNTTSSSSVSNYVVPAQSTVTILSLKCSGELKRLAVFLSHDQMSVLIYADGETVSIDSPLVLNDWGIANATPGISLTKYTSNGNCVIVYTLPIQWKRMLEVKASNPLTNQQYASGKIIYTRTT